MRTRKKIMYNENQNENAGRNKIVDLVIFLSDFENSWIKFPFVRLFPPSRSNNENSLRIKYNATSEEHTNDQMFQLWMKPICHEIFQFHLKISWILEKGIFFFFLLLDSSKTEDTTIISWFYEMLKIDIDLLAVLLLLPWIFNSFGLSITQEMNASFTFRLWIFYCSIVHNSGEWWNIL